MRHLFKKIAFPLLILIIDVVVFLANYKQGTYLIGWDNVFPEFNFLLNIKRDFFAVWQQYRGLGLVDGMSHTSLIIHDLTRLLFSLFMTTDLIRWVYILGLHLVGGLGMMRLLRRFSPRNETVAFLGALFYMFNLGSIIQFYLPLEVFIVHFAFLPWIVLFALRYLQTGRKKDLLLLSILSLLATPQAHVPTVFIAYTMGLSIILFVSLISEKFRNWKKILIVAVVIFATNAFWFIPFAVTNVNNSKVVANTKAFQMSSNDIFYRNNKYGDFPDVALIKGLPLEFRHLDYKTGETRLMMWPWVNHINSPFFYIPAWIFFFLAVFGLFHSLRSKNKNYFPFATVFIFSFFMLGTDIPIINWLSQFLRNSIPLFNIIFRFTFTKFSIVYIFSYSVLLTVGVSEIIKQIKITKLFLILCFLLIISYSLPSFQGHFFYENLAVKIPDDYFKVFDFFKSQNKDERIAELPIPWYWAWLQPKWGTINSGFIWHGIEQPLMDLAFMPWGTQNENYYWELDQAIYSKNPKLLKKVLQKYDISLIYLDKNNLSTPGGKITYSDYEEILSQTEGVKLSATYGLIQIYHFDNQNGLNNFITIKNNLKNIGPDYKYDNYDLVYLENGDYYTNKDEFDIFYPFRSLFSGKNPSDIEYRVTEDSNYLYFRAPLPKQLKNYPLKTDAIFGEEFSIINKDYSVKKYTPEILQDSNNLIVKIKKQDILLYKSETDQSFSNQTNDGCDKNAQETASFEKVENGFRLISIGSHNCIKINLPDLSLRKGYLINIKTKNDNKRGFSINLFDSTVKKTNLETYLDNDGKAHNYYFIASPRSYYGLGYTLYFDNLSEGREKVVNELYDVSVYQIPYYFLKSLKIQNNKKPNISSSIYYLSQSYHPGWIAIASGKILPHVKVNNWANGWILDDKNDNLGSKVYDPESITIIFLPQYLEFLGFILLAGVFLRILFIKEKS
jgi:hypothetical protein